MNAVLLNSQTHELEVLMRSAGYFSPSGNLTMPEALLQYRGVTSLDNEYVKQSGGLLRAISRKSVDFLRNDLIGLTVRTFSPEYRKRWKYILMHYHPHLDEYLASFLLRACLPDDMHNIIVDETILYSRDDDAEAKRIWPEAAVLGVGNLVNGGAEPLLLFDEHELEQEQKNQSSLVMLMKRYLLDNQRPPSAFYQILREVNFIDQYGSPHPKSLAVYAKYIQSTPLPTASNAEMSPEWKCSLMDAGLAAFYCAIGNENSQFEKRSRWEPALQLSLNDFAERTALRSAPEFGASFQKIKNYLTKGFSYQAAQGGLVYHIPNVRNPEKTSPAVASLLIPYLPNILFYLWGGALGQILLFPLWESRIMQDILFTRSANTLKTVVSVKKEEIVEKTTDIGKVDIRYTKKLRIEEEPVIVIDLTPAQGLSSAAPVNNFVKTHAGGIGFSIFRSPVTGSIVITRGEKIPNELWERVCDKLIELEGLSDRADCCGAWHVTRNTNGIAPFILNGNPTHRYVPRSSISAHSLVDLLDDFK